MRARTHERLTAWRRHFRNCSLTIQRVWSLPTVGESLLLNIAAREGTNGADLCRCFRLELGRRLAELLNEGEPAPRATVSAAVAPVPSVTSLGMPFALPLSRQHIHIKLSPDKKVFEVSADGFIGNGCRQT